MFIHIQRIVALWGHMVSVNWVIAVSNIGLSPALPQAETMLIYYQKESPFENVVYKISIISKAPYVHCPRQPRLSVEMETNIILCNIPEPSLGGMSVLCLWHYKPLNLKLFINKTLLYIKMISIDCCHIGM